MSRYPHERPGWYRDPDDPRRLRYWDGTSWTARSRKRPPWSVRAEAFEVSDEELDRSTEGPVHPHELRETVASGASSREWLSWRGRAPLPGWHRRAGAGGVEAAWAPQFQPAARLGPGRRRPLVAIACLVAIAVAVVVSSVAVITPYQNSQVATRAAEARYAVVAGKYCRAALPKYRDVLASSTNAPSIDAAAHQVDLLRKRLSAIPVAELISASVVEWLQVWARFTAAQRHYAALAKPGARAAVSPAAQRSRQEAHQWAALADELSVSLQLPACRLEPTRS